MYLNIEIADYLFQTLSLENIYFLKAQKICKQSLLEINLAFEKI
jgi:hypothetical protein